MTIRYHEGPALVRAATVMKGAAAVIPKAKLERLIEQLEDKADRAALRRKDGEYLPAESVKRVLRGESVIRVFREWRAMSQDRLAGAAGIGKSMLSQIETGKKQPSLPVARRLAAALGVGLDEIC